MRFLDIVLSMLALLILIPLFIVVMIVLKVTGEGEVFFIQKRVGKSRKHISVIKFATMLKDSPNLGSGTITSKNDPRILPVGRVLRKTKLNELPQLVNVILGDMSLIGPRPHAQRDLEGVDEAMLQKILTLKPGLSGVASLVFRNEELILQTFENPRPIYDNVIAPYKAQLELWYLENQSRILYIRLIWYTILALTKDDFNLYTKIKSLPKPPKELHHFLVN